MSTNITASPEEPSNSLPVPSVGGDVDAWGVTLNEQTFVTLLAYILWLKENIGGSPTAEAVAYDPTTSGLTAEDVQAAIDEVYAAVVAGGIPAAQGLVVVQHGDDGNAERPAAAVVLWRGSAAPDNAVDGDLWDDSEDWD